MITFYETGFNNEKLYIILEDGMQIGQLKLLFNTRYGQRAVVQNLKKQINETQLAEIMSAVQTKLGIQTYDSSGNPKFKDDGIGTIQIF